MPRPGYEDVLLVTGFPSLYARTMIEHVLDAEPTTFVYATAGPKHAHAAQALLASMTRDKSGRVEILEATPTAIDLGLSGAEFRTVTREIDRIHHIVHTSDVAAEKKAAFTQNVVSVAEVLEMARASSSLRCLVLHSTAAVSGERHGVVYEADLDEGQSFRSHVAETRMRAEAIVRRAMGQVPIAVVRPTTIIGERVSIEAPLGVPSTDAPSDDSGRSPSYGSNRQDARSDEASFSPRASSPRSDSEAPATPASPATPIPPPPEPERLSGLYLLVLLLVATSADRAIPLPGRTGDVPLHVVPLDYVVRAARAIGKQSTSAGRTFHLADPNPPSARRVFELVSKTSKQRGRGRVPSDLAKLLLRTPGIESFVRSPRAFVEELMIPVRYDTRNTEAALEGTGVVCPPFESYVAELVEAVEEHIRRQRERHINSLELEVDDPLS